MSPPDPAYGALMNILYAEAAAAFEHLTLSDLDDTPTQQDDEAPGPTPSARRAASLAARKTARKASTACATGGCRRWTACSPRSTR